MRKVALKWGSITFFFARAIIYTHPMFVQAANALAWLHTRAGASEHGLIKNPISVKSHESWRISLYNSHSLVKNCGDSLILIRNKG